MASNNIAALELIAIFSVYCAILCPILCWVISSKLPGQLMACRLTEKV